MDPKETGERYDQIAAWWLEQMNDSTYGLGALHRALAFVEHRRAALDVGCGCECRFLRVLLEHGFECTGVDISAEMIVLARERQPAVQFVHADIVSWTLPGQFDLITAWDSTFHLPLAQQAPVLEKLCAGLGENGVLLFTCGGVETPGTISGSFGGCTFDYSTLGVPELCRLLWRCNCVLRHLDYDQYPEKHVCVVAQRASGSAERSGEPPVHK